MNAEKATSELTTAILPLEKISTWQITLTARVLEYGFGVKTIILPATEIPSQCFNTKLGRYRADQILNFLFFQLPIDAQRIVGIVAGDLENKNEPCLGLAYLYHRVALYMVPRLSEQQPNQINNQIDQDIFSYHLIIHEFGHTLGLEHCDQSDCAMNNSAQSSLVLCAPCRRWADRELIVKPGSAEERFSWAESLLIHDCFTQAIAVYRQAIYRAPREPLYYNRLGLALYKAGQLDKANQELAMAKVLSNDDSNCYYNLGLSFLNNQLDRAEDSFDKAIAAAKDPQFTHRLIGQAYREILHDVERTSRHYKEYLRLGGDDPDVVEWLVSRSQLDQL